MGSIRIVANQAFVRCRGCRHNGRTAPIRPAQRAAPAASRRDRVCAQVPALALAALVSQAALAIGLAAAPVPRQPRRSASRGARPHAASALDAAHLPPHRTYHIVKYVLALHFDQSHGEVFGDEIITLKPLHSGFRRFYLDSTGLTITRVRLVTAGAPSRRLGHFLCHSRLWITLKRSYPAGAPIKVRIVYHGFPRTGLFFVNPTRHYPHWPREVYSQGEPELNHFWFPCWDYPNDMSASETITTVPAGEIVVSNGRLVRVTHDAGLTTYDWKESVPHSSYLISIAVGPWRRVVEPDRRLAVDDYVPRGVSAATAHRSFHLTPDMIGFFSRAAGVAYPYEKYAQTTVHNFIFGGQENVSATTLTDATLHSARADLDFPSTALVAHELGQQWFGDYVQGRDWADIWLNEGFATYLQALYTQYHSGFDAYRLEIYRDQRAAQREERKTPRPLVFRRFRDPLDMFDAITHQKGAAVLDMLRYVLDGPGALQQPASQREPLFRALRAYLLTHRARAVGTPALVHSVEAATGRRLGWFFHQWVYQPGVPAYRVSARYDSARGVERVAIRQIQSANAAPPVFVMPIQLAFFGGRRRRVVQVWDDRRSEVFHVHLNFQPQWVDFDPHDFIDKRLQFHPPVAALIAAAERDPAMMSRLWAVRQLGRLPRAQGRTSRVVRALVRVLRTDSFYAVRAAAAAGLGRTRRAPARRALLAALWQSDSRVRAAAVASLAASARRPTVFRALRHALHHDSSERVAAAAAQAIGSSGDGRAFACLRAEAAQPLAVHVMPAVLAGLAATGNPRAAGILLAAAAPGRPEPIRLAALGSLPRLQAVWPEALRPALIRTVQGALHDPYLLTQLEGAQVAGSFGLRQFRSLIRGDLHAPLPFQRRLARSVLRQLGGTTYHHALAPAAH